jgi:hypothetical protein
MVMSILEKALLSRVPISYIQVKPKIFHNSWHFAIHDVDKSYPHVYDSIVGSSKFHSIYCFYITNHPTKLILMWDLLCICPSCVMEEWDAC